MSRFTDVILDAALRHGADEAEARVLHQKAQRLVWRDGAMRAADYEESQGVGVRVRVGRAWGYACSPLQRPEEVEPVVTRAVAYARAANRVADQTPSAEAPPLVADGTVTAAMTPVQREPFVAVPMEEKVRWLQAVEDRLRQGLGAGAGRLAGQLAGRTEVGLAYRRETKTIANTSGMFTGQVRYESGAWASVRAEWAGLSQERTFPHRLGGQEYHASGGFEWVEGLDLPGQALELGRQAAELVQADPCPQRTGPVLLDSVLVAALLHAAVRPELERGRPVADADRWWADTAVPGGLGSLPFDDRGRALGGRAVGGLPETELPWRSAGWGSAPAPALGNLLLRPGSGTMADLAEQIEDGVYLTGLRGCSAGPGWFRLAAELARPVRQGVLGPVWRDPVLVAEWAAFWPSLRAVAGETEARFWGFPGQGSGAGSYGYGIGAPPAWFAGGHLEAGLW